jgi:AraC family transcriptional regulator, transcriptional activator FtrA
VRAKGAAGIDLCLHIVRADHGAAYAAEVARHMVMPPAEKAASCSPPAHHRLVAAKAP